MEKKLREIVNVIIDYVIEENLPIQLDDIYIYNEMKVPTLNSNTHMARSVYDNIDRDIYVNHIYSIERQLHFFIIYGLTEEEFSELVDKDKLRKRFL